MLTVKELERRGYKFHHSALARGYQRKGTVTIEKYSGKYGKGYKVFSHNPKSTSYKNVDYYIKKQFMKGRFSYETRQRNRKMGRYKALF